MVAASLPMPPVNLSVIIIRQSGKTDYRALNQSNIVACPEWFIPPPHWHGRLLSRLALELLRRAQENTKRHVKIFGIPKLYSV